MSSADKAKLDGITTGANAYVLPTASATTLGGVKTTSTVLSATGHTPCPIISGVPYYKDTTYSALKNPYALTLQGNGTTLPNGTYDGSEAKTVNITPSSIGAATGRVLTSSGGSEGSGKVGYIGFAQLKAQAAYSNKVIEFKLVKRHSNTPCYVSARFANSADTDPDLVSLVVYGTNYEVFAHKTDVGTWVLYAKKSEIYDNIDVVGLTDNSPNSFRVEITYPNTFIITKPTSNVVDAVYGYTCGTCESCTGNASTASKLETARTINGVAFDGSTNITLPSGTSWIVGGAVNSKGYYRFLSKNLTINESFDMDILITSTYYITHSGIFRIYVRRDSGTGVSKCTGVWLIRKGWAVDSIAMIANEATIDFYLNQPLEHYGRVRFTVLDEQYNTIPYTTYSPTTPITDEITPTAVSVDSDAIVGRANNATSATKTAHSYSNDNGWYQMLLGTATTGTVTETPVGNSSILANPSTGVISAAKFHQTNGGKLLYDGSIGSDTGSITISRLTDYNAVLIVTDGVGISGTGSNVTAVLPITYLANGNSITVGGGIPSGTKSYDQGTSQVLTGIDGKLTASIDTSDKTTINLTQSVGVIGNIKVYSL